MNIKRLGFIAMMALILNACAVGVRGSKEIDAMGAGIKILPISTVGDTFSITYSGTTVFNNAKSSIDVTSWKFNTAIETMASEMLSRTRKFVPIQASNPVLRNQIGDIKVNFWSGVQEASNPQIIVDLAKKSGADFIIVFSTYATQGQYGPAIPNGYGIFQKALFNLENGDNYFPLKVMMFDGKTGANVSDHQVMASETRARTDWMRSNNLTLSPETLKMLEPKFKNLARDALTRSFREMNLIK